jgi:hypothetical protein
MGLVLPWRVLLLVCAACLQGPVVVLHLACRLDSWPAWNQVQQQQRATVTWLWVHIKLSASVLQTVSQAVLHNEAAVHLFTGL